MAGKTEQAFKIAASWSPSPSVAESMLSAALAGTPAAGCRLTGGRMAIKHSIRFDFSDPGHAVRVSERVAEIKATLASKGTLHSFETTAGAVPTGEAEVLPTEDE